MNKPNKNDYNFGYGHNEADDYYKDLELWMDEMTKEELGRKALRVQTKCLWKGKKDIAKRIEKKYLTIMPRNDLAMAFNLALFSCPEIK